VCTVFVCMVLIPNSLRADGIDWERLSFGMTANYQVPYGDFGRYWNNGAGGGGFARYQILDRVYLMGSITAGYFTPVSDTGGKAIPHVWLANAAGSIHFDIPLSSTVKAVIGLGGDNFTFIFRGTPAERLGSNYIESEMAVHGEGGLAFDFPGFPRFDLYTRYASIFSYPDQIPIWLSGINIYVF
jgi:hypothetical protein